MKAMLIELAQGLRERLNGVGEWLAPLGLRVILAWEFWESGMEKLNGQNWFADLPWASWQVGFPWPFNLIPADANWFLATWSELIFAVLLLVGLFTRFTAFSLFIVTVVATVAVHWPNAWDSLGQLWEGYQISPKGDVGNYKLPLLFMIMLLPLILKGPGKLSLDTLLVRAVGAGHAADRGDALAWGIALVALGLPIALMIPTLGFVLAGVGVIAAVAARVLRV